MFTQFYGFDRRPFRLTPDPAFYFESTTHRKALSCLQYGLAEEEGIVLVTGEVGAGKSLLAMRLEHMLVTSNATTLRIVASALTADEILAVIARNLGLGKLRGKAELLAAIEQAMRDHADKGRRLVLIIDEAHHLSPGALEEVRMLANVQDGGRSILQTVLFGPPSLGEALSASDALALVRARIVASHHLGPLEEGEIEPYIVHQLARAGWQGRPTFDAALWPAIMASTGGIARSVNRVMNRLLLLGAVEGADRLDQSMLQTVLTEMEHEALPPGSGGSGQPIDEPVATPHASDEVKSPPDDAKPEQPEAAWNDPGNNPAWDAQPNHILEEQLDVIERAFAERDAHIAALREQIELIMQRSEGRPSADNDSVGRFAEVVARLDEHERSLRHLLQMMIAYFETGVSPASD